MIDEVFTRGESTCEIDLLFSGLRAVPHYLLGHRAQVENSDRSIIIGVDISDRRKAEAQIQHLALYDAFTDLPNRVRLRNRMAQEMAISARKKEPMAVLFIDLDGFKIINDDAGHDIGDIVLKEIAQRLQKALRISDTVARYGGDEFVVVLSPAIDRNNAVIVAKKLIDIVSAPVEYEGKSYSVGASIGISLMPDHAHDLEQLLEMADAAMYRAKKNGKGRYEVAEG
jgi:diguanylate cyclase (GGDEF)-like protein